MSNDQDEILSHKEFKILKYKRGDKLPIKDLQYSIQQMIVARWIMRINQRAMLRRLFLVHDMGSGKTIGSILASNEHRQLYRLLGGGNIIVLSFQRATFMKEILSRPELGYITYDEYNKLQNLQAAATNEYNQIALANYISFLKKRILNNESIIRFIGYRELHNMLFTNLQNIEEVSKNILAMFANAFIICDEIHNTYNSQTMNIYGEAIKYILRYYEGTDEAPNIIYMSGTPISNKPSESIDMLNLISPVDLKKADFFKEGDVEKLLPGALGRIASIASGYFSFYKNEDPLLLPRKIFDGVRHGALSYIECNYTKHQAEIIEKMNDRIGLEDHNLFDAVLPLSSGVFYKNADFNRVHLESVDWKNKMEINYNGHTIVGNILNKKNIRRWSEKYWMMLDELEKTIADSSRRGKMIIYHGYIDGTGIKFIEQILIANGYLSEGGIVTARTLCSKCGLAFELHKKTDKLISSTSLPPKHDKKINIDHVFEPIRFLSIYGELDKTRIETIMDMYESPQNIEGHKFMILLGSEMIREGYNFKCIRNIWSMHLLPHISALLQLWGRAIRMYSHDQLSPEKRTVYIKIFATPGERQRYAKKLDNYKVIQSIMQVINRDAIDSSFYYDFIKTSFLKQGENAIGLLPYDQRKLKHVPIKLDTYNVFYGEWEIEEIKKIIISMFIISPAWSYKDLLAAVRDPPFIQNIDYNQISEDNFIMALGDIMYGLRPRIIIKNNIAYKIICVSSELKKNIYYVIYPVNKISDTPIGIKIENLNGQAIVNHLSWIQSSTSNKQINIPITTNLLNLNTNYNEMKRRFFNKYQNMTIMEMPQSTEVYGIDFHIRLIEEAITYVFGLLTNIIEHRSEYHEFYFKMLHFYNKIDLIVYANMVPPKYAVFYEKYIIAPNEDNNQLLISNISNISSSSISSFEIIDVNNYLNTVKGKSIEANRLPVGHMLTINAVKFVEPKLYTPQGWFIAKDFIIKHETFPENDIIIGYYSRIENSINFKFKLRPPVHKIVQKSDRRELEKGTVCETISKNKLEDIARQLNIISTGTNIVLCERIKETLLHRELKERKRYDSGKQPSRVRWCYLQNEPNYT